MQNVCYALWLFLWAHIKVCCCRKIDLSLGFVDLMSFNGKIFLTTQAGRLFEKPRRHFGLRALDIKDVGVLAFDWLTNQLYWTNTKLNLVSMK